MKKSIEKFPSLVLPRLYDNFRSFVCPVVTYGRLKIKENFKLLALKVVAVAYKRWSLTRVSK